MTPSKMQDWIKYLDYSWTKRQIFKIRIFLDKFLRTFWRILEKKSLWQSPVLLKSKNGQGTKLKFQIVKFNVINFKSIHTQVNNKFYF